MLESKSETKLWSFPCFACVGQFYANRLKVDETLLFESHFSFLHVTVSS